MKDVDPRALIRQPDDRKATHRSSVAVLMRQISVKTGRADILL